MLQHNCVDQHQSRSVFIACAQGLQECQRKANASVNVA